MNTSRMSAAAAVGLLASAPLAGCAGGDSGGDYPSGSIRWVVPYAPGGGTDATSRVIAACMGEELGEDVIVENLDGGGGSRGTLEIINAQPDGYTMGLAISTGVTLTPMIEDFDFSWEDIHPVGAIYAFNMSIAVAKDAPYQTAEELFEYVKEHPGEVDTGVPTPTSPKAIAFQALAKQYGLEFNIIPMGSSGEVNTGLLGGNLDAAGVDNDVVTAEFVESGDFIPLAIVGSEPWGVAPDVPTLEDLGYGEATLPDISYFLATPNDIPDEVQDTLEDALKTCEGDPEVIGKLGGEDMVPDPFMGTAEVEAELEQHVEIYSDYVE
ncbi:MAG: tripartite tricarboxylate transporter substrate binding protein [Nocardioides sp.]|nr:tripartite tricarboxylate transporter substrate binding protein [Nocardioides sp.]